MTTQTFKVIDKDTGWTIDWFNIPYGRHPADALPELLFAATEELYKIHSIGTDYIYVRKIEG